MRFTLRVKLLTVVAINALALVVLVASGSFTAGQVEQHLNDIRDQYLPRVALRPRLHGQFERLQRALQDAAAAADSDLLAAARGHRDAFITELATPAGAIAPADAIALERALDDYYSSAHRVSSKMIDGDTGDRLGADIEDMQEKRERAAALIDRLTEFDEGELAAAFASATAAQRTASRLRLVISFACLVSVLGLSLWISRGVLRRLGNLTAGFARFGEGAFDNRIPIGARDELGEVAARANEMAEGLERLGEEQRRIDWIKSGRAGLAQELRGELEPAEVADRSVGFLARTLGAPVGALYYVDRDAGDRLELLGGYALGSSDEVPREVTRGEGLVGQAALETAVSVVTAPSGDLRIRSAVVEGPAHAVVLVPLVHSGSVTGVLELAILEPWSDQHQELVLSVRETLTIAIEVACGRAATRRLLHEITDQAAVLEKQRVSLQRKNAELVEARRGLELKAEELAAASRYKSQFLANMSHELRTPLNAIIGFAELMHDGVVAPDSPEHSEFLGDILTSGRHLLQLINDVLDLSKVEAGKLEFRPERTDLATLINEVLAILRTTSASKRIAIESSVEDEVAEVVIDPARLKQVLYNYLSNALKFTPEGGRVSIRALAESADQFRLEVSDSGIGIAEDDIGRLFVEFQQARGDGQPRQSGTGLGLALTRRLVEAQGGRVGVESELGKGSLFFAVLPRLAAPIQAARDVAIDARPKPQALAGGPSVLVIEDDARDAAELVEALGRGGYSVEVATTGAEALARCGDREFDAITLDLLLPDMNGLEVLRTIRASARNREVPIIVITVVAEPGAVAGFAVHDLLPKPVSKDSLLEALARAGVPRHQPGDILVVDDDPGSLKLMTTTLEQLGYETRSERDGESALGAARDRLPSAVVLDLLMPGMDGFEFLDRLRSDPGGRQVPVIVWTVMDLDAEQRARLRASAQAVVLKGNGGSAAVVTELETFLPKIAGEV
jgi:signal transduction histidine kinase/DNA-binding response OmpR family regulator/HAMP domain-containing protein